MGRPGSIAGRIEAHRKQQHGDTVKYTFSNAASTSVTYHQPRALQQGYLRSLIDQNDVSGTPEIFRLQMVPYNNHRLQVRALLHRLQQHLKKTLDQGEVFKRDQAAEGAIDQRSSIQPFPREFLVFSRRIDGWLHIKRVVNRSSAWKIKPFRQEDQFRKGQARPGRHIK